jgi:hypothetical protein
MHTIYGMPEEKDIQCNLETVFLSAYVTVNVSRFLDSKRISWPSEHTDVRQAEEKIIFQY